MEKKRSSFTGRVGFILAAAGSAVGLGNLWRFPYLAAKYGGGIFLLVYIILAITFGFALMVTEIAIGRKTGLSCISAYKKLDKRFGFMGWLSALVPVIITPYYCVIGGWVIRYFAEFVSGHGKDLATSSADFFSNFTGMNYLLPDFSKFSSATVLGALGQLFYSMSLAMGIMITYGSYMKKEDNIEKSVRQIEIFDTGIALLAGLIIIPSVVAFNGGSADGINAGPGLMFITLPQVFNAMGSIGGVVGTLFFLLVFFAAITSSISLMETVVSMVRDKFHWNRIPATIAVMIGMIAIGTLSVLGYGPLANFKIFGMQMLDFFDFISNSVLMPIVAFLTCILIGHVVGTKVIADEVGLSAKFTGEKLHRVMIKWVAPILLVVILVAQVLSAFGIITI